MSASELVREVGGCGVVSPDGQRVCVRSREIEHEHEWDDLEEMKDCETCGEIATYLLCDSSTPNTILVSDVRRGLIEYHRNDHEW